MNDEHGSDKVEVGLNEQLELLGLNERERDGFVKIIKNLPEERREEIRILAHQHAKARFAEARAAREAENCENELLELLRELGGEL